MYRTQLLGLACLAGGLLFMGLNTIELVGLGQVSSILSFVLGVVLLVGLMGGPFGLLALRAAGTGMTGHVGLAGAIITLLGLVAYLAGVVVTLFVPELGVFYLLGALLSGLGMFIFGIAALVARQMSAWRRFAPLLVGLYYVIMIPIQVMFFIIPNGAPSEALLGGWGLTWALLGYAIYSTVHQRRAAMPALAQY